MDMSLNNPFLIAMKRKKYDLTCGMYNLCFKNCGGMHLYSNPSLNERNKKLLKRRMCPLLCKDEDKKTEEKIYEKWVKPLEDTDFWERLAKTDLTLDDNFFIFSSPYTESTLRPLALELTKSDIVIEEFFKAHSNMFVSFILESCFYVLFIDKDSKVFLLKLMPNNDLDEQFVLVPDVDPDEQTKLSDFSETEEGKEAAAHYAYLMSVIECIPYVRVEGRRVPPGQFIARDAYTKIYNDTPFTAIVYL